MPVSFKTLIFLIVPVLGSLIENDPGGGDFYGPTRSPHRTYFYESSDGVRHQVSEDEMLQLAALDTDPSQSRSDDQYGNRVETFLSSNPTGFADMNTKYRNAARFVNHNLDTEDSNLGTYFNSFDAQELPSIKLTPQKFINFKVLIPRDSYTTRLYRNDENVDIIEIVSKPNKISMRNLGGNIMTSNIQQLRDPYSFSSFNSMGPVAIRSQIENRPLFGSGMANLRSTNGFGSNLPYENPTPSYSNVQYTSPISVPINFNQHYADQGNNKYSARQVVSPESMDDPPDSIVTRVGLQNSLEGQHLGQQHSSASINYFGNTDSKSNPAITSGDSYNYNRGLQKTGGPISHGSSSSGGRFVQPLMSTSIPPADSTLTSAVQPTSSAVHPKIINTVRSLDKGSETNS